MNLPDPDKLALVPDDSPILREPCHPVTNIDEQVVPYIYPLKDLMRAHDGVGIAAPQVGIALRFFIFLYPDDKQVMRPRIVINPRVIGYGGPRIEGEEGCLSFPLRGRRMVPRWEQIQVAYNSTTGAVRKMRLAGDHARVFQHETDHVNGICIFS